MLPWANKYLVYYPVQLLRRETPWRFLDRFKKIEKFSRRELINYQLVRVNELIRYVSTQVKFFSNFKAKSLQGIKSLEEIQDFPILNKSDIAKAVDKLNSQEPFVIYSSRSTSGTTGEPFCFFKDRLATSAMEAAMYSVYGWHGIEIGDRQARIWGSKISLKDKLVQQAKDRALNRRRLSAFHMSEGECLEYYYVLQRFRPKYIYAYPSGLYRFIEVLRSAGIDARGLNISSAICTGEILFDEHRRIIEDGLGSRVVNEYGTTENGIVAFECGRRNMHVLSQTVLLEIVRPDGSVAKLDEEGEVLITELFSRSIPFIRYKTGDKAVLSSESCKCGMQTPIIKKLSGRIDDFIIKRDGQFVHDAILAYTIKSHARKFKAVQKDLNTLVIYIIPIGEFTPKTELKLSAELKKELGADMAIEFVQVSRIEVEASGKHRYFVREF